MADVTVNTNLTAIVAPVVTDDSDSGYSIFSPWVITANRIYWAMDVTVGAAIWYAPIQDIVQDLTPQLGANLDVNGNQIVSVSNGDIIISPNGTGNIGMGLATSPISILHVMEKDIGVTEAMLSQAPHGYLAIEDEDARIGLFSENEGGHGSTLSLAEVNAGVYQDQWAIGRLSSGSGSHLYIEYGTNTQYGTNTDIVQITTDKKLLMPELTSRIGLRTADPLAPLHIVGQAGIDVILENVGGAGSGDGWGLNVGIDFILSSAPDVSGAFTERMRLEQSGEVGIGKTGVAQLDIAASVSTVGLNIDLNATPGSALTVTDSGSSTLFIIASDGDVTITKAGGAVLTIAGTTSGDDPKLRFNEATDGWNIRHVGADNTLRFSNVDGGTDRITVGVTGVAIGTTTTTTGKLIVKQESPTQAKPVLVLEQIDVSEEIVEFACTIGVGNAIEAVGAKTLTTTHFIKVTLPGGLTRYLPVGTIS